MAGLRLGRRDGKEGGRHLLVINLLRVEKAREEARELPVHSR